MKLISQAVSQYVSFARHTIVRSCQEEIISLIVHFLRPDGRGMCCSAGAPLCPAKRFLLSRAGVWLGTSQDPSQILRWVDFRCWEPPCRQTNVIEAAFHSGNSLKSNILFLLRFNPFLKLIKKTKQENHSLCLLDGTWKNGTLKGVVRNLKCYLGFSVMENVH